MGDGGGDALHACPQPSEVEPVRLDTVALTVGTPPTGSLPQGASAHE